MTPHVVLVGFMGAGKSTIGVLLARELARPFVDTDALVVERYGPIEAIFAREGVARFREYERQVVHQALAGEPAVIALGGGAVTHPPTRALLEGRAVRVYLDVPVASLVARLQRSSTVRPVLGAEGPTHDRVRTLLAAREPLYRQAEFVVPASGRSKPALARRIAALVRTAKALPGTA